MEVRPDASTHELSSFNGNEAAVVTTRMDRCEKAISEAVRKFDPELRVERIGSGASGFCAADSDLDLTIIKESGEAASLSSQQQVHLLQGLQQTLQQDPEEFSVVEMVDSYKVPILRLSFQNALHVDVSCDKVLAIRNTRLLKAYKDLGPEVRELVVHVKKWAKMVEILGARIGNLSSYAYTLMAIYYLQVEEGLPCLPTAAFTADGKVDSSIKLPSWEAKRPSLLPEGSELFAGFLRFYTKDFHWGSEVISVRVGKRVTATDITFADLQPLDPWRIHIEDPFELNRNLNYVLQPEREMQLWLCFYKENGAQSGSYHKQMIPYCDTNSPNGCTQMMGYAQPQKYDQQAAGQQQQFVQQVIFIPQGTPFATTHCGSLVQQGAFPQQGQLPQQQGPDGQPGPNADQVGGGGFIQCCWPKEDMQMMTMMPQTSPEEMSSQMGAPEAPLARGGGGGNEQQQHHRNGLPLGQRGGGIPAPGGLAGGAAVPPRGNKAGQPVKQYVICSTTGLPVLDPKANNPETEMRGICCGGECSNIIPCRGIHISNIPTDMLEHDLHRTVQAALQESAGGSLVGECRVWMSQDTSQKPGFAYAELEEEASVARVAKLLNGQILHGRQVSAQPTCSPLWRPPCAKGGRNGHEPSHEQPSGVKPSGGGRRGRGGGGRV
jgi:hypothetical protein